MRKTMTVALLVLVWVSFGLAHKPIANDGTATTSGSAIYVSEPDVSRVIYHEVTAETPQIWLKLEADAGYELYVSLGVPVIDRLADYRPAVAVVGPGLPEADVGFEVLEGMGAKVFESDAVAEPRFFHEPFTGTDSWIYVEEYVTLPESGVYYVVGYHPENEPGKLWVSTGTKEKWGVGDILTLPGLIRPIREFHETR